MDNRLLRQHRVFDDMLHEMEAKKIGRSRVADVLIRLLIASPTRLPQSDITHGVMLPLPYPLPTDVVSRSTAALTSLGLITAHPARADRPGRPYTPLQLGGNRWAVIGVKIGHEAGRAVSFDILVLGLDGQPLDLPGYHGVDDQRCQPYSRRIEETADPVSELAELIQEICALPAVRQRYILGVGVELAGHVFEGDIVDASHSALTGESLGLRLSERLDSISRRLWRLPTERVEHRRPLPVIIDNDINVLAVHEIYDRRFAERDVAVVAVFDDGIGSALILDGRVYRGARGMAGEIGHCVVPIQLRPDGEPHSENHGIRPLDRAEDSIYPSFSHPCHCGRHCHLDCYATPVRILGELGKSKLDEDFARLARSGAEGEVELKPEVRRTFEIAGRALGIGIAGLINLVNPARVLLYLPPSLAGDHNSPIHRGSAAEIYCRAITDMIDLHAFSNAATTTSLMIEPLDREWRRYFGAKSAALRVLDSFVQHAKRRCKCYQPSTPDHRGNDDLGSDTAEMVGTS
jgi:predicted NBD/HSP70 family sugar kinase